MDLASARGAAADALEAEKRRFQRALRAVIEACPPRAPKILVTDSQALDIVHPWTLDDSTGEPLVDVTTFSVAMMHRQSGARLPLFAKGMDTYETLKPGARILMAEACNHNRITDKCNDVGTVQIPSFVHKQHRAKNVTIDHAFGREFPDVGLSNYDLIVHCGACMIDHQKVRARISDAADAGVPITNYGLLLAYAYHGRDALHRVLDPGHRPTTRNNSNIKDAAVSCRNAPAQDEEREVHAISIHRRVGIGARSWESSAMKIGEVSRKCQTCSNNHLALAAAATSARKPLEKPRVSSWR
ncbi:hypothetical protein CTAYLR_003852 [Chrysophaeum taylorii]|uniref:Hydrogen maturase F tetramerization domain-containing protein n=1 Tax=Chrysophaeum taylorii TaxID=2483200 RepID=A0AAD7UF86_9STRA|nr:hypothetical protein CTAYLR_003852 [Chrysophaeum taylorii]